jgi:lipopolysaccharide/colanic/teichoic acid biosynthesis glycosyltransferase
MDQSAAPLDDIHRPAIPFQRPAPHLRLVSRSGHGIEGLSQSGLPMFVQDGAPIQLPKPIAMPHARSAKRNMDIALTVLGLLALAPLLCLIALMVKLTSPGPVLFAQWRPGLQGRPFRILKFRTLRRDSADQSGIRQIKLGDERLTPIGAFLRRTSLDELPQLVNVLRGEMSLVGPRPHVDGMMAAGVPYDELVPYYNLRHAVRPGITGWAQANGLRGPTECPYKAKARVDHDIAYVQNHSPLLDLRILWRTVTSEFLLGSGL